MATVLKLSIVLLCGYVLLGTMRQVATDFSDVRTSNQERIEKTIDNCR